MLIQHCTPKAKFQRLCIWWRSFSGTSFTLCSSIIKLTALRNYDHCGTATSVRHTIILIFNFVIMQWYFNSVVVSRPATGTPSNPTSRSTASYSRPPPGGRLVPYPPENKPPPLFCNRHDLDWGGGLFSNMHFPSIISPPWPVVY